MRNGLEGAEKTEVVQLRVTLVGSQPKIWRLIQVPETLNLRSLHEILQLVMGWTDAHHHEFRINGVQYVDRHKNDVAEDAVEERKTKLNYFISVTDIFEYIYDYGDGWKYEIEVVDRFRSDAREGRLPLCLGGELACPPEDCGGISGYSEFLKRLGNAKHPEHKDALTWIGGFFDPRAFDPNHINREYLWKKSWS